MRTSPFIVLFTRSPEDEARAKRMPLEQGSRLFWSLLSSWKTAAEDSGARLLVIAPEGSVGVLSRGLGHRGAEQAPSGRAASAPVLEGRRGRTLGEQMPDAAPPVVEAQRGRTFGERLADAAARAFERGASAVLLVGGDSPPPALAVLRRVISSLEEDSARIVLAPAEDGGVNLIGLARPMPELLTAIVPGSSRVLTILTATARAAGRPVVRLPAGRDLDRAADVARAWRLSFDEPIWRPFRALLRAILAARPAGDRTAPRQCTLAARSSFLSRAPPIIQPRHPLRLALGF